LREFRNDRKPKTASDKGPATGQFAGHSSEALSVITIEVMNRLQRANAKRNLS